MTQSKAAALVVFALGALACGGGGKVEIDPNSALVATRWNAILSTPPGLAGALQVKGSGWMASKNRDTTQTTAFVSIENAVPGGEHPWHVHLGQCGSDRGIFGSPQAYKPLKVKGNGRAESTADLALALPSAGQYFINVHASAANMRTIIACGNLAPPTP